MTESDALTDGFEQNRTRLRAVAYRMLGSLAEADDAVQETWLRLRRSDASGVDNLGAWLTTIVARVCLNVLRSRRTQREEPVGVYVPDPVVSPADGTSPEDQALLADSVGLALQVVLDTLTPAERLAFVLHDLFDLPFDEIAPIVGRTAATARQLASRARRRVRGAGARAPDPDIGRQREVVDAFFAAARRGDFDALVAVLDPDIVLRADGGTAHPDGSARVQGAAAVAGQALMFDQPAALVQPALVNGAAGAVVTVDGQPFAVMAFTVSRGRIAEIDILADPERLLRLNLAVVGGPAPEAAWAKLGAEPGLCLTCRHAKLNQTRRGTAYLRCGRSAWDDRLVRYPRLPVLQCTGFEARETGHAGGTTDRSAENLRPEPGAAAGGPCGARGWERLGGTASGGRGGRVAGTAREAGVRDAAGAAREAAARQVAGRMAAAAADWLGSLDAEQRAVATGSPPSPDAGADAERRRWFYTPTDHGGLTLGAQRPAQQRLAHRLVASGLSAAGYVTVATIVGLDNVLDQVEGWSVNWGRERGRDPGMYYLRVFGEPGGAAPWGWRFGGHHVSLNNLITGGVVRAVTPCFLGADPAVSPLLGAAPLRPLAGAEDLARELVRSLDPGQGARAILLDRAPSDIMGGNRSRLADGDQMMYLSELWRRPFTEPELAARIARMDADGEGATGYNAGDYQRLALTSAPKGLPARDLDGGQRDLLRALLGAYLGRVPDGLAPGYDDAALDGLCFAWAGPAGAGQPVYYRVQGPRLLIEYDNTQRHANHAHSVWRDPAADFGYDVLGAHLAEHHLR